MTTPERVSLVDFLSGLDDAAAAEARVAAARIDELARTGNAMEGVERRYLPWAIVGAILFVAGIVLFFMPGTVPRIVTIACIAALPVVAVTYGLHVMPRSRADAAAEDLNLRHFLPHGGIYFAAGDRPACVVRVPPQQATGKSPKISRKDIWW